MWSAHLPYAEQYLKLDPTAKLVVLERPRAQVVASFANKSSPRGVTEVQCLTAADGQPRCRNHWQQWRAGAWWDADNWDAFFPKFPGELQPPVNLLRWWAMVGALLLNQGIPTRPSWSCWKHTWIGSAYSRTPT